MTQEEKRAWLESATPEMLVEGLYNTAKRSQAAEGFSARFEADRDCRLIKEELMKRLAQ